MDKLRRDLKIWLRRIENYYKVKPILYTSYKFKTRYLNDSVFNSYPYWIAHYYVDSVEYQGSGSSGSILMSDVCRVLTNR